MIALRFILPFAGALACANPAAAQTATEVRRSFQQELAKAVLDSDAIFQSQGERRGWLGVVLVAPGTSIAPLAEAYNGLSGDLARYLAYASTFDRALEVRQGIGYFTIRSLSGVWSDFLRRSMPIDQPSAESRRQAASWIKWLFRRPDEIEAARGVAVFRQPSEFMLKYTQYQLAYENLLAGRNGDNWKLDPKLSGYRSFEQAQNALLEEWMTFGYKAEIEKASKALQALSHTVAWKHWADAQARYDVALIALSDKIRVAQTFLFPPPTSWGVVGSWIRLQSAVPGVAQPISFQLQRVKIERPWMDIEALLSGRLTVDPKLAENAGYQLSSGEEPTFERSPDGDAAVFVEELLLVRGIHSPNSPAAIQISAHPLSVIAYPDAINLIGYVVRVLPKMPR